MVQAAGFFGQEKLTIYGVITDEDGREKLTWSERKRPDLTAVSEALGLHSNTRTLGE